MSKYIPVETPGGTIWAEIDANSDNAGLVLTSVQDKAVESFEEVTNSLKKNAQFLLNSLAELAPTEVEVSCGIKVGAEGGNTFFGLAKASGEASYTITLKWKSETNNESKVFDNQDK